MSCNARPTVLIQPHPLLCDAVVAGLSAVPGFSAQSLLVSSPATSTHGTVAVIVREQNCIKVSCCVVLVLMLVLRCVHPDLDPIKLASRLVLRCVHPDLDPTKLATMATKLASRLVNHRD